MNTVVVTAAATTMEDTLDTIMSRSHHIWAEAFIIIWAHITIKVIITKGHLMTTSKSIEEDSTKISFMKGKALR